jgi:hypothetical protein
MLTTKIVVKIKRAGGTQDHWSQICTIVQAVKTAAVLVEVAGKPIGPEAKTSN